MEYESLLKEQLIDRLLAVEEEQIEFSESSKELERALEEEIEHLEIARKEMKLELDSVSKELYLFKGKMKDLSNELKLQQDMHNTALVNFKKQIEALKGQLVDTEINNDTLVNTSRHLESQLGHSREKNNELIEKITFLEQDLDSERRDRRGQEFVNINNQNEIKQLNESIAALKQKIKSMSLRSNTKTLSLKPSRFLLKSHLDLCELSNFFEILNEPTPIHGLSSLDLKSPSTIHVSTQQHLVNTSDKENIHPALHLRKSIRNLSRRISDKYDGVLDLDESPFPPLLKLIELEILSSKSWHP